MPVPTVIENFNKMIHCGDSSHGGAIYDCPKLKTLLSDLSVFFAPLDMT